MTSQEKPPFTHDPSATAAFAALPSMDVPQTVGHQLSAVVIGGGTGAPVSIRTLLSMGMKTSAVVAMADDGGSTGVLRDVADVTAPGDIRKCITAMAADAQDPLTKAFKMRFTFADNHALGNLILSALEVTSGSFPDAIAICERMLNAHGHVYPSTLERVTLEAETRDGRIVEGQALACHSRTPLARIRLLSDAPLKAYGPAVDAIMGADLVVLGPGSLYTSIMPNLAVPGIAEAVRATDAPVVFVCSLADVQGETRGLRAIDHYRALEDHGMAGAIDYMLVHAPSGISAEAPNARGASTYGIASDDDNRVRPVEITEAEARAIQDAGTCVLARDLVDNGHPTWHDPRKLQLAFLEVVNRCRSPRM